MTGPPTAPRAYPPGDFLSGLGGSYEAACQAMVLGALDWWDQHPDVLPHFVGFKGVFGNLVRRTSKDALDLAAAMSAAADLVDDAEVVEAMHHQAIWFFWRGQKPDWTPTTAPEGSAASPPSSGTEAHRPPAGSEPTPPGTAG